MSSVADIANNALVMLGQRPIQSLDDNSDRALSIKTIYATNRDSLLRKFPWNFARKQLALNQLAIPPVNLDFQTNSHGPGNVVFSVAFAAPTDMLRLYRWAPEYTHWRLVSGTPFNFNGLAIITDAIPSANSLPLIGGQPPNADGADNMAAGIVYVPQLASVGCEYIAKVDDPNLWDPIFTDCLIASVARDMAFTTTGLESLIDRLEKSYQDALMQASAVNGMENWADQLYDNSVANVRYGYSGTWFNG